MHDQPGIAAIASVTNRVEAIRKEQQNSRSDAKFEYQTRDHYPVRTTVKLENGQFACVVTTGRKTMVKLQKSGQIREAKDNYVIVSGLFRVQQ